MKNLSAEICKFRSLVKTDSLDGASIRTKARIGGHHAFDVGPYLDGLGIERRTDDCGGKIGTATAQGCWGTALRGSDKSSHYRNLTFRHERADFSLRAVSGFVHLWSRRSMVGIGNHTFTRVNPRCVKASQSERRRDDLAGKQF